MAKYFTIERIKSAIGHLSQFHSTWIIVPLVFAVNDIGVEQEQNPHTAGRQGTDRFLDKYFNGSLIGLPPRGNSSLRPKFEDVATKEGDFVAYQPVKLWGSHYSSRGYREMELRGLVASKNKRYVLKNTFFAAWEEALGADFHFEELLVWLYAFTGVPDNIHSWESLFVYFQEQNLGPGGRFPAGYEIRFNVNHDVPWPENLLSSRPSDNDYQKALIPSEVSETQTSQAVVAAFVPIPLDQIVGEFEQAVSGANLLFGLSHGSLIRNFLVSVTTKPFVILSGLSGSGKTQLAKKLGEWFGKDHYLIVAVRPDWSSPDQLFGYENLLDAGPNRSWIAPDPLRFMLDASRNPSMPYLLILDEMNIAHVERYFGDFLSGIESSNAILPNLLEDNSGNWRMPETGPTRVPIPDNLIVVGTINVDETTYMFSPKVLDRANTLEFRVSTDDLVLSYDNVVNASEASQQTLVSLLSVARDRSWQKNNPGTYAEQVAGAFRNVHKILSEAGFEFGHRVFAEAIRFSTLFEASGGAHWRDALDAQIYQKVLPRLYGSQRTVGPTIRCLGHFCSILPGNAEESLNQSSFSFNAQGAPELPLSYIKLKRMYDRLRAQQFTAFAE
jgi:hypothetical protein